jgi:predicted small metal-binding protein
MPRYYAGINLELEAEDDEQAAEIVEECAAHIKATHKVLDAYQDNQPEEAVG